MQRTRATLHRIFHDPQSRGFFIVNDTLAFLTIISVLAIALESVESLAAYRPLFITIEYVTVGAFTLEYLARICAYGSRARFVYAFGFFGIIDLLAVLPSYLSIANLTFLKATRILRILRFLRMLRLAKLLRRTTQRARTDVSSLNVQIYFFALASVVTIFGALLYVAEGNQLAASNIPLAMIWTAKVIMGGVTQAAPTTLAGDLIIIATRFCGLLLFGLLIHIMGGAVRWALFGSRDAGKEV